jgi:dihydrodipicolinate synthase/N-acetylneuraminate lyase
LFYLGTGGEFSQMNAGKRMDFAEAAIAAVGGRVPVLIGVGSPPLTKRSNWQNTPKPAARTAS